MYITGGRFRRRRLSSLKGGDVVRPTSGRVRAAWMNILLHRFSALGFSVEDAHVLDLFAGTGALGLEMLSYGARHVTFIERDPRALTALQHNIDSLGVQDTTTVLPGDVYNTPAIPHPVSIAVMDPPYRCADNISKLMIQLSEREWLRPGAIVVTETDVSQKMTCPRHFEHLLERAYGKPKINFFLHCP